MLTVHLQGFAFHPLFKFEIVQAHLIDMNIHFNPQDQTGLIINNQHKFMIQISIDSVTLSFDLDIHKFYWDDSPFFVLNISETNNGQWSEEIAVRNETLESMMKYICKFSSTLVEYALHKIHPDWLSGKIFLNEGIDDEAFSAQDCLIWSKGQATLENFKIKIFHSSYRLMDKYSPSAHNKTQKIEMDENKLPEYLENPMTFNYLNDFGFNYILTRLIEVSTSFSGIEPDMESAEKIRLSFNSENQFQIKLSDVIGEGNETKELNLICVKDNSIFMNMTDQGMLSFDSDLNLDFGNKNILSDLIYSNYKSFSSEMIKQKDNKYFLLMVIEAIVDLNFDFARTGNESKAFPSKNN
jgi:hypothetical protein